MKFVPVALVLVCACVVPEPEHENVSEVEQLLGCPEWMCQSNSPVIDNYGFHELNVSGVENSAHIALHSASLSGSPVTISVSGGQLRARLTSGVVITGSQLTGLTLNLKLNGVLTYQLRVLYVSEAPLWAGGQQVWVPTYLLQWTVIGTSRWTNVCPLPDKDMGMQAYHSVVFEGDRINAKNKWISDTPDTRWFNIGCAGHTLAKMYLTGHTYASKAWGYDTKVDERRTMLKMLSGDYCGHGTPYTVAGTPLDWKDDHGWMKYIDPNSTLEARWTQYGARCLNTPRIEASQYAPGLAVFPDVVASIAAECSIPACDDPPTADEFMGYHLLSANPP